MTTERIDNLADARRLSESYHRVHAQKAHTDDNVGAAPVHGVAGTGMDGIEVELDALASTERNLAGLHDQLMEQMRSATVLTDKLQNGSGPVAVRMREAFLRRADVDGGVQKALREYMEELFDMRVVILQTLAGPEALRRKAKRDRSRQRNRRVALPEKINWDSYQHHELYDMIMSAQPKAMAAQSDQWRELAGKIERTTSDAQRALTALMNTWRGTAAVAAAASTTRLMQWAGDASHTAARIAAGLADYTDAVSTAQHRMPEPGFAFAERNFRAGHTVVGTGGPSTALLTGQLLSDHMVSHKEAADRKAAAVDVMNSYESESKTVHNGLPDFEPVRPTTNPNLPPDDSTGGGTCGAGTRSH